MSNLNRSCINIVAAFQDAQDELLGRGVVCTGGQAGTVAMLHLDEEHGLRVTVTGHPGKWPVSTIRHIGPR
jgi:hypothetical protein